MKNVYNGADRGLNPFYFRAGLLRGTPLGKYMELVRLNPFYFRAGLLRRAALVHY